MQTPPRFDIYASVHKGLRAFMTHTLLRVGRLDAHDVAEVAEVSAELAALLDLCASHLRHENDVIHASMHSRRPGSASAIADEHVQHTSDIAVLRALLARIGGDAVAARELYHALACFVAHNFEHMHEEETAHNEVLWATHSDDEIHALHQRILAAIAPREMQLALHWMVPHLTPAERAAMLGGMRQSAPAPVFDDVVGLIRPLLGGREWHKLSIALGL